jgi:hypothetical protein
MDRRYKEAQGFSLGGQAQRDATAKRLQARARSQAHTANAYGGSTGGLRSIDNGRGLEVMQERAQSIAQARQVFKDFGSGALGARKAFSEARVLPE